MNQVCHLCEYPEAECVCAGKCESCGEKVADPSDMHATLFGKFCTDCVKQLTQEEGGDAA